MQKIQRQRLYVDMDGTLAVFTPSNDMSILYEEGYFRKREPHKNVVEAVRMINSRCTDIEVYVLSAYLQDSKYALIEKNLWLDDYLPEIDLHRRVFVPCGVDKKSGVEGGLMSSDTLLDDYTKNLNNWIPAKGIKLLNGINHTNGTWKYDRIRYDRSVLSLAYGIVSIMRGEAHVYDEK